MNIEMLPESHEAGKGRERLLALEQEGQYVFHGSPIQIDVLEPRQSNDSYEMNGKMQENSDVSVSASPYAEIAIFRAIIHPNEFDEFQGGMGMDDSGQLVFDASKKVLDQIKDKKGYVYVLPKSEFQPFSGEEMRSAKAISPIEVVEVNYNDLPKNIKTI